MRIVFLLEHGLTPTSLTDSVDNCQNPAFMFTLGLW
jgi:hypothetical protein